MTKTINITKEGGEVLYRDYIHESLDNALKTVANGKYTLSIKKNVKKRTLDQNALMWLWFSCIQHETGQNINDIHDYYCTRFLNRVVKINGRGFFAVSGTSKLNTESFTNFLNNVQADAASEFGITLPLPEDLQWEAFKNEYEKFI